ncbi:hypothetical protein M758_12G084700 [Ceratodon purpureus]|uniref:Uncharacterized protein n=1 Tax=Ceratodon purpureus TaxID=3225 RepID=A0A8T0G5I0_CERPU|nr:hypothetical protein KC19_12G082100 [Ceratodon purpureus]KAG0598570.1 hypothetical protein M758_12G084700 [Ceratodon purpureus]
MWGDDDDDDRRGMLWRLPKLRSRDWGTLGPAFGYGIGCGVGLGAGIVGGAGIGLGFPGLQVGFGVGAGCGVGVGFGYGLGKGRAYDENGTYSNVGRLPKRSGRSIAGSSGAEIGAIIDDLVTGVKRALDGIQNDNGKRRR